MSSFVTNCDSVTGTQKKRIYICLDNNHVRRYHNF